MRWPGVAIACRKSPTGFRESGVIVTVGGSSTSTDAVARSDTWGPIRASSVQEREFITWGITLDPTEEETGMLLILYVIPVQPGAGDTCHSSVTDSPIRMYVGSAEK